jgi:hypothetical protein
LPNPSLLGLQDFAIGMSSIATNTEVMNILFRSLINAFAPLSMASKYWRFSFGDGLPHWSEKDGVGQWENLTERTPQTLGELDDLKMVEKTRTMTEEYMDLDVFKQMVAECAAGLTATA